MDSEVSKRSFPLLELPKELRDLVYEHVLFESARTTDICQRRANLDNGIEIHTNVLLTSRQVFEEARNVIIGAHLVQVISHGDRLQNLRSAAAIEDGIPMFHEKYRHFCLLKHIMDECWLSKSWWESKYISYIIRREDLYQFCGGVSGLDPNSYVTPMMSPRISHVLMLVNPEARLPPGPKNVSIRVPTQKRLLQVYRRALGGCQDIWISAHWSVEPDPDFMKEMVEKIKSSNTERMDVDV